MHKNKHHAQGSLVVAGVLAALAATGAARAQEEQEETVRLEEVEVVGVTPIHGVGLPRDLVPANIQSATSEQIDEVGALDISEFMNRRLPSVQVNQAQNNPLQPDVQYRGFVASPLLGLPQGLSLYADGVRLNDPFGDTVNWDLIPESAIADINLIPGSNPLFGRNTLGGALSIRTKSGFSHPGTRGEIYAGSFDRKFAQVETGGASNRFGYFITAEYFDEDGWRDFSPSEAARLFGTIGWRGEGGTLDLSLTLADTDLIGNGAAPIQLLRRDREAIFTRPDRTENELVGLNLRGSRFVGQNVVLDANVYYRRIDRSTLNGDDSDFEECEEAENAGLLCEEEDDEEEVVLDPNGNPVVATPAVIGGTVNTSETEQDAYGLIVQATFLQPLAGRDNQLIIGVEAARSKSDFRSQTELASLDETRRAIGSGILDGSSFVDVEATTTDYAIFFTDTLSLTSKLAVTLSGRYNYTEVELDDQLGTALTGDHTFKRFNPAVGATYQIAPTLNVYGSYSESNRVPSPVELTCADEDAPCRLPNAFVADPPLDDVVAKTFEVGVRGRVGQVNWSATAFNTRNEDDIIFISAGPLTNQGFFDNIGDTRRRGIELSANGRMGRVDWFASYTYLEATFETPITIASDHHPLAVDGEISVEKGDRLPGIPRNIFKAGATVAITPKLQIGGDLLYNSDRVLRGDESNQLDTVDGFTVVNLRGEYRFNKNLSAFIRVDNVFDEEYETFGVLGEPDEVLGDEFDDPRFLGPGAPRGGWIGLRLTL